MDEPVLAALPPRSFDEFYWLGMRYRSFRELAGIPHYGSSIYTQRASRRSLGWVRRPAGCMRSPAPAASRLLCCAVRLDMLLQQPRRQSLTSPPPARRVLPPAAARSSKLTDRASVAWWTLVGEFPNYSFWVLFLGIAGGCRATRAGPLPVAAPQARVPMPAGPGTGTPGPARAPGGARSTAHLPRLAPPPHPPLPAALPLYFYLEPEMIYSTKSASVWLAKFCGVTAAGASVFLLPPVTKLLTDNLR